MNNGTAQHSQLIKVHISTSLPTLSIEGRYLISKIYDIVYNATFYPEYHMP